MKYKIVFVAMFIMVSASFLIRVTNPHSTNHVQKIVPNSSVTVPVTPDLTVPVTEPTTTTTVAPITVTPDTTPPDTQPAYTPDTSPPDTKPSYTPNTEEPSYTPTTQKQSEPGSGCAVAEAYISAHAAPGFDVSCGPDLAARMCGGPAAGCTSYSGIPGDPSS